MSSAVMLFLARILLLLLLYAFLYLVVRALRRDLRAVTTAAKAPPPVAVSPAQAQAQARSDAQSQTPARAGAGARASTPVRAAQPSWGLEVMDAGRSDLSVGACLPLHDPFTVGRSGSNDVTLDDDWVSGQHLRLTRQNGAWLAEDLGSTNGTRVNGQPFKGMTRLKVGDTLQLGRVTFRVVDGAQAQAQVRP